MDRPVLRQEQGSIKMKRLGMALVLLGVLILVGYGICGLWKFALAKGIPMLIGIAGISVIVGMVVMLLFWVVERAGQIKKDKYGRGVK